MKSALNYWVSMYKGQVLGFACHVKPKCSVVQSDSTAAVATFGGRAAVVVGGAGHTPVNAPCAQELIVKWVFTSGRGVNVTRCAA